MSLVKLGGLGAKAAKKTAPFYSAVDEALANLKRPKGTGLEFLTEVLKQPGVKKAEIADRKLEQAFKAKGKITKEEAQQVLEENPPPQIKEKVYDESTAIDEDELREMVSQEMFGVPYSDIGFSGARHRRVSDEVYRRMDEDLGTKFGKYKTGGGENYREILLKLPTTRPSANNYSDPAKYDADLRAYNASGQSDYYASHFPEDANIIAHMRVQDRKGPNGEKILHIEEIQSDLHQAGRKSGYNVQPTPEELNKIAEFERKSKNNTISMSERAEWAGLINKREGVVPDAPFKKNWHELAMKRLLNYAADNGYDSVAITPGKAQIDRYEDALRKNIDSLEYEPFINDDGKQMFEVAGFKNNKQVFSQEDVTPEQLQELMGKDTAQKIAEGFGESLAQERPMRPDWKRIQSSDLSIGGEGMKGFYDKILPDYLNNFGKQYGAQVETFVVPSKRYAEDLQDPMRSKIEYDAELPLHNFKITPEMRQQIQQKGLPLYQQVGIPTIGTGAASQMLEPQEEPEYSKGGSIAKMAALAKMKKMKEEMAPRAEAVKALIARDQNRYLADVVPNSLTNAEIESEIKRMAAKAPMIMKPSALTELRKIVQQEKGDYGSRRLERAADEIPNLEKMYQEKALREAFTGDNAKALMTMNPADFEKYAAKLFTLEPSGSPMQGSSDDYLNYLRKLPEGFRDVPFLEINKREQGAPIIPFISGHEGRHRSRALTKNEEPLSLVRLMPRSEMREPFPRRSQQEYIEALKEELALTGNKVKPENYTNLDSIKVITRPPIDLPDIYAKGGAVKQKVKTAKGGGVRMTENRDTMFMELSNKKLKRK
jgi:hypothetical protein